MLRANPVGTFRGLLPKRGEPGVRLHRLFKEAGVPPWVVQVYTAGFGLEYQTPLMDRMLEDGTLEPAVYLAHTTYCRRPWSNPLLPCLTAAGWVIPGDLYLENVSGYSFDGLVEIHGNLDVIESRYVRFPDLAYAKGWSGFYSQDIACPKLARPWTGIPPIRCERITFKES